MRLRLLRLAILAALLAAGCGSDDEPDPAPAERKEETAHELPRLERGYEEFLNRDAGIALGRPPGWSARGQGGLTTLKAPDDLVAATITVDRTDDALSGNPRDFATQTIELLPGYEKPIDSGKARSFAHRYDAAIAEGEGVAKRSGVRQRVRVVALERPGAAVVTAVVAENAERNAGAEAKQALEAVRTLRTRPPG